MAVRRDRCHSHIPLTVSRIILEVKNTNWRKLFSIPKNEMETKRNTQIGNMVIYGQNYKKSSGTFEIGDMKLLNVFLYCELIEYENEAPISEYIQSKNLKNRARINEIEELYHYKNESLVYSLLSRNGNGYLKIWLKNKRIMFLRLYVSVYSLVKLIHISFQGSILFTL